MLPQLLITWILLSTTLLTICESKEILDSYLDLTEPLLPFSNCTIQLVYYDFYQIFPMYKSFSARTSFESVPLIISTLDFESIPLHSVYPPTFTCERVNYDAIDFGFFFTPQHPFLRPCSIQVHLIPCQQWVYGHDVVNNEDLGAILRLNLSQTIFPQYKSIQPHKPPKKEGDLVHEPPTYFRARYTKFKRGIFQALVTPYLPLKVPNKIWYDWCFNVNSEPYGYPEHMGNLNTMLIIHSNSELTNILQVYMAQPMATKKVYDLMALPNKKISTITTDELEAELRWNSLKRVHWHHFVGRLENSLFEKELNKQNRKTGVTKGLLRNKHFPSNIGCILLQTVGSNSTCRTLGIKHLYNGVYDGKHMVRVTDFEQQFLLGGVGRMGFLTCSGGQRGALSWSGFVSVFDWKIWLGLLIGCIATLAFLKGYNVLLKQQGLNDSNIYWVPFLVLFEQGTQVSLSRLREKPLLRWICGTWLFFGIVVSNLYRGENIGDITSPLKPKLVETFQTLATNNYTLYSPNFNSLESLLTFSDAFQSASLLGKIYIKVGGYLLKNELKSALGEEVDFNSVIKTSYWPSFHGYIFGVKCESNRKLEPLLERLMQLVYFPKSHTEAKRAKHIDYFIKKIASCNNTALVAWDTTVQRAYSKLKIYLGTAAESLANFHYVSFPNDRLLSRHGFMIVEDLKWPAWQAIQRFGALHSSGIGRLWINWSEWFITLQDQKPVQVLKELFPRVKKVSLADNVVVVYYMFLSFLLVAFLIFLAEIIRKSTLRRAFIVMNSFMLKLCTLIANRLAKGLETNGVTSIDGNLE